MSFSANVTIRCEKEDDYHFSVAGQIIMPAFEGVVKELQGDFMALGAGQ